jgi:uroporphyrinogen-III synthase
VRHVPAIAIESAGANGEIERARSRLGEYDWVVLTSKRGVSALLDGVQSPPSTARWAAVGATTAKALRDRGVRVDVVPTSARGDAIPDALAKLGPLSGSRVLLARADAADNVLPQKLIAMGAHVDALVAYHTITAPATSRRALLDALADGDVEAILFASGSAVRGTVELAGKEAVRARALQAISIGPKTSSVARELGFQVVAEAETQDGTGLRAALRRAFDKEVERWVESQLRQPA